MRCPCYTGCLILFDLLCHQSVDPSSDVFPAVEVVGKGLEPPTSNVPFDNASADLSVSSDQASIKPGSSTHSLCDVEESVEDLLRKLNLESFQVKFEEEQIDMDSLVRHVFYMLMLLIIMVKELC